VATDCEFHSQLPKILQDYKDNLPQLPAMMSSSEISQIGTFSIHMEEQIWSHFSRMVEVVSPSDQASEDIFFNTSSARYKDN
jgi:hypothetical protein